MSFQAVKEYLALIFKLYQGASRKVKSEILSELQRNLGIHRKSAIRLMNKGHLPKSQQGRHSKKFNRYSSQAKKHLEILWKDMGYMGSQRMKAAMPKWLDFYCEKKMPAQVKAELLRMSEKTMDRYLKKAKADLKRRMNTGTKTGVRALVTQVPVKDFTKEPAKVPGHAEIDTVAHCGNTLIGKYAWTLTVTDIATGWTENVAMWNKTGIGVRLSLEELEKVLPFKITHLYFDNGTEFMNKDLLNTFAKPRGIKVFRGRPYRKNDQCHVEQKNYTTVRFAFGYGRIDWQKAIPKMNSVYRNHWSMIQNFYYPQTKVISKTRYGSKLKRHLDKPKTPFERLKPFLEREQIEQLTQKMDNYNPILGMKKLRIAIKNIYGYLRRFAPEEKGKIVS